MVYDTQATDHELHESKNGHQYYLLTNRFSHSCVTWVLLIHSTELTRFNSQRVQPGNVAMHPICAWNRVRQIPIAWHQISVRFDYVSPSGGTRRASKQRKWRWLCRIWNIFCTQLDGSTRFTDGCLMATCMLQCCGSVQHSRLPLTKQQATTDQLQLKQCKGIALHLRATMNPLFPTGITYMHSMFFSGKRILIQVSWGTMLTSDMRYCTTMWQSINRCINALLQHKLRSSSLQIFGTDGCIFIRQVQLLALRLTGQGIGYNIQWSLPVQYGYGQLIHPFEPMRLTSTKVWLYKYMLWRFVVSIYHHGYTINVTPPLYTCLEYCQQLFLAPTIFAFRQSILATMVRNGVQTIIILL